VNIQADEEPKDKKKRKLMSLLVKVVCWISWTGECALPQSDAIVV